MAGKDDPVKATVEEAAMAEMRERLAKNQGVGVNDLMASAGVTEAAPTTIFESIPGLPDKKNFTPEERTRFLNFINTRSVDEVFGLLDDVKRKNPQLTDFDPQRVSKLIIDTRNTKPFTNIITLKSLPGVGWGSIRAIVTKVRAEMIVKSAGAEPIGTLPEVIAAPVKVTAALESELEEVPPIEEPVAEQVETTREKITNWDGFYKLATSEKYKSLFNATKLLDAKRGVERLLSWVDKEKDPSEDLQSKLNEQLVKELRLGLGEVFAGETDYSNYKPNDEQLFNELVADILGEEVKTEKKVKANNLLKAWIARGKDRFRSIFGSQPIMETTSTETPIVTVEDSSVDGVLTPEETPVVDLVTESNDSQTESETLKPNQETFNWKNLLQLAESTKYKSLFNIKVLRRKEEIISNLFVQDKITPNLFKQKFLMVISFGNGLMRDNFLKNTKLMDSFVQELFSGAKQQEKVISPTLVAEPDVSTEVAVPGTEVDADAIAVGDTTYKTPAGFDAKVDEIFDKPPAVDNLSVYSEQITETKKEYKDNTPENKVWNDSVSAELRNISEYMGAYILILSTQDQYLVDASELSAEALQRAKEAGEDKVQVVDLIKTSAKEFSGQCKILFSEAKAQKKVIASIGELFSEEAIIDLKKKITEIQIAVAVYLSKNSNDEDFVDTVVPEFSKYVAAVMSVGVKVV